MSATAAVAAVGAAVTAVFGVVLLATVTAVSAAALTGGESSETPGQPAPPGQAEQSVPGHDAGSIPPAMLALYRQAAPTCPGLDWSVLAGVGSAETDHGRSTLPGVHSGENSAGAAGPMQFLAATFATVTARHPPPPGGAHPPSRYNAHDAVFTAAAYLCDSGARTTGAPATRQALLRALFAYNHSGAYGRDVLARATAYRATGP